MLYQSFQGFEAFEPLLCEAFKRGDLPIFFVIASKNKRGEFLRDNPKIHAFISGVKNVKQPLKPLPCGGGLGVGFLCGKKIKKIQSESVNFSKILSKLLKKFTKIREFFLKFHKFPPKKFTKTLPF